MSHLRSRSEPLAARLDQSSAGHAIRSDPNSISTSANISQSLSDWYASSGYTGESEAVVVPYRLQGDGSKDARTFHLYGYSLNLNPGPS